MTELTDALDDARLNALGVLNLAHVGDAVYELLVRTALAEASAISIRDQHRATIAHVAAPAQARAMERILPHLTGEEHKIYRRGRNVRVHGVPGGSTIAQYHAATALEALFGWLWLRGDTPRVRTLFSMIWEDDDAS